MNATRHMDRLLVASAVLALGAVPAHEPLVALAAGSVVLVLLAGRAAGAFAALHPASIPAGDLYPEVPSSRAFAEFGGQEPFSGIARFGRLRDDDRPAARGDGNRGSRSYEEFAAGLKGEEDEEISFIPPYASDTLESGGSGDGSRGDSLLSADLAKIEQTASKLPVPRRFALGTVAIIRRLLEPDQVERILLEQRRYPRLRFGDVAVQLGLLSDAEVQELLVAQEQGIFSDEEISDARRRLAAYHGGGSA